MRVLLQRVTRASVSVEGRIVGEIGRGFVALVGVTHDDAPADAELLAHKTAHLRVFEDADGKMNVSALDAGAGVLVVSQFTLYGDMRRGRRPDFMQSAPPDHAKPLVEAYAERLTHEGITQVANGIFGAMMHVDIQNWGPVTLWLDSAELGKKGGKNA
jgi:D-tyrosyl-tRNA(Tyr) deacylase